jgi:hypothetical protein
MDRATFRALPAAPAEASPPLTALWHVARGDWAAAHALVQDEESAAAAWVHAHLHRVEGDEGNAGYWYRRAGKPHAKVSHDEEWQQLADALLTEGGL